MPVFGTKLSLLYPLITGTAGGGGGGVLEQWGGSGTVGVLGCLRDRPLSGLHVTHNGR